MNCWRHSKLRSLANKQVVFASGNAGKLREVSAILAPLGLTVEPQSKYRVSEADETGVTFVENALIKARHAAEVTGKPAIADDSGICVSALGGAPGVRSARYAGVDATDEQNLHKLLEAMRGQADQTAWFHCAMVFLNSGDDPAPIVAQARWSGSLTASPAGGGGFGYDPIFKPFGLDVTSAELLPDQKNTVSHRGKALRRLLAELETLA